MANQFLALSMFIMLLSFFLVLNSMSNYESDRAKPVLSSIASVFGSKTVVSEQPSPSTVQTSEQSMKKGDVMDRLKNVFTARIAGIKAKKNRFGTSMILQVPLDEFEKILMDVGQTQTPLTQTLVTLLYAQSAQPYRMDILLGVGRNPAVYHAGEPANARSKIRKAAMFTQMLEEAGMPRKLISAGLGAGNKKYVELRFERYDSLGLQAARAIQSDSGAQQQGD